MNKIAERYAMIQPVLKAAWDALDHHTQAAFARDLISYAEHSPGVAEVLPDTFEWEVAERGTIDGLAMPWEDEEGNTLPEYAYVRASVMAIRGTDG